jgi:hypothetical protein
MPTIETLITTTRKHVYDAWIKEDGSSEDLCLYIDSTLTSQRGTTIELQMDKISKQYYVRDGESPQFRLTARMGAHLFKIQGWPYLIGVFSQNQNALDLRVVLKRIYQKETGDKENPLFKVLFNLREHDDALLQCFPNMKRLKVSGIQGAHVREALFKGETLEESPEYQKYVKDENFGGQIRYFGVPIGEEEVIMSTFGFMYSRHGKQRMPVNIVQGILRNLLECHALVYEPTMDNFVY